MKANILQLALATLLFAPLASPSQVTTTADAGPGSLRYALSAAVAGATIAFAPGLSGQTIILTGGEVQLTDAMARMIGSQPFHAVTFAGKRYDCGSKMGFVEATLALALERPDRADEVRAMAKRLLGV